MARRIEVPHEFVKAHSLSGGWRLYELLPSGRIPSFLWIPFKLILIDHKPRKWNQLRSYYFAWNPLECRFQRHRFVQRLIEERPALAMEVETFLNVEYGPAQLRNVRSEPEIQAEVDRLAAQRARVIAEGRKPARFGRTK